MSHGYLVFMLVEEGPHRTSLIWLSDEYGKSLSLILYFLTKILVVRCHGYCLIFRMFYALLTL